MDPSSHQADRVPAEGRPGASEAAAAVASGRPCATLSSRLLDTTATELKAIMPAATEGFRQMP